MKGNSAGLQKTALQRVKEFSSANAIVLVLAVLVLIIGAIRPSFMHPENLLNILKISSVRIIIALGCGGILLTRGTDLSAGRTVGFAAVVAASLAQRLDYSSRLFEKLPELPLILPFLAAIGIGLIVGLVNGSIVAFLKVPPFIATLGTMVMVYGAVSLYVDRPPRGAQPIGGLRDDFTNVGTGDLWVFPILIIIALAVIVFIYLLLNKTRFGKNIYAMGGNPDAAVVSGVSIWKTTLAIYVIGGILYGLAGALLASRTGGATNNYGSGYELDAIAACVIGGVSTSGGIGTVGGMITGVVIFEVVNNGLVVLGVSAYWQQIIKGIIIVIAVAIDIQKYLKKR